MKNSNPLNLKSFDSFGLFTPTDPANIKQEVVNIELCNLQHYANHPFRLYTGERLDDMVESIKANGIFSPLVIREVSGRNGNYEVLSGHNRLESARIAGLTHVPCIIKKNLSEEEAMLIVTESNLIQRSFSDLTHSERAAVLAGHHEAIKQQGKRTDLLDEIEKMLKVSDNAGSTTSCQIGERLYSDDLLAKEFSLSSRNVSRYLRVNKLIPDLKNMLDEGLIAFIPSVTISYLTENEQKTVHELLLEGDYKLDIMKADALRKLSIEKKFAADAVEDILSGRAASKKVSKLKEYKIKAKSISKYFRPEQNPQEIESTIIKALEYYFANNPVDAAE